MVADQVQSRAVVTVMVPSAPAGGAIPERVLEILTSHRAAVGAVTAMLDEVPPQEMASSARANGANSRARIARVPDASALPAVSHQHG